MTWFDIVWSMTATASLMLGLIHAMVWLRQRRSGAHLAFACAAFGAAAMMLFELLLMEASSATEYAFLARWIHVPITFFALSLIAFAWLYLGAGRAWLAGVAAALRVATLVVTLLSPVSVNYASVDAVRHIEFFGATAVVALGTPNPLAILPQIANLALVVFVLDAWWLARARADPVRRRRIGSVVGGIVAFILVAGAWSVLIGTGAIRAPYATGVMFSIVLVVMSYDLVVDLIDTARLSGELRASEALLRESEQRTDLAVASASLALWTWDVERRTVRLSQRGIAMLGFDQATVPFEAFIAQVHPEDRAELRTALDAAANDADEHRHDYRLVLPGGEVRWISVQLRGSTHPEGRRVVQGVANDVTVRRAADDQLRRVEREVAQQRDELAHLSRVSILSELSGSLAHELNQPLAAILSNAQAAQRYLEKTPVDLDELRAIVADIVENDRRAGEVIKRLRAMLKKEAAHYVPLDLNDVVFDALRLMRSDLLNRNVSVQWRPADGLPEVAGDRVQLQQVLLNLVANGCDAMTDQAEAREIRIRTVKGVGTARIEVGDCGKGIAEAEIERVFEPFVTTKPDGMGLGLAVCRSIVAAHGGRIWAARNGDRGTTLHVELPSLHRVAPAVSALSSNVT